MCLQNNSEFIKQGNIGDGYLRLKRCKADVRRNQNKITTSEEEDDQQQGVTGGIGAVQF